MDEFAVGTGVADEKYEQTSGDASVKAGDAVREKKANVLRLLPMLERMMQHLHDG